MSWQGEPGLPPPRHDPDDVRALADEILAQPRYRRPAPSLIERIQDWFTERISEVLSSLFGGGAGTVVAWVLLGAALAAIVYLVVRFGRVPAVSRPAAAPPSSTVELARTPAQWRDEAAGFEARGAWGEALRCRYRALIGDLVRAGVIPDQPGRTTGEHLRDVATGRPEAALPMAAVTEAFEAVHYGGATVGPADLARFVDLEAQVLAARGHVSVVAR